MAFDRRHCFNYWAAKLPKTQRYAASDDAEQPQDEDQDQQSAKTDVHIYLLLCSADETVCADLRLQSFRLR
jgi:hypothetical protein